MMSRALEADEVAQVNADDNDDDDEDDGDDDDDDDVEKYPSNLPKKLAH